MDLVPPPVDVRDGVEPVPGWDCAPQDCCGIAVDILRASTTLTVAWGNGIARVVPLGTPAEAIALREMAPDVLACGERGGRRVPGFDLGNSPHEYVREKVAGKTLAFASTNGSWAMKAAGAYGRRWLGAFVNASSLLAALDGERFVRIVCGGRLGQPSSEDTAFAGWLCGALQARGAVLQGEGLRALRVAPRDADEVRAAVEGSDHAADLRALGPDYARDIEFCAALDSLRGVHGWSAELTSAAPDAS